VQAGPDRPAHLLLRPSRCAMCRVPPVLAAATPSATEGNRSCSSAPGAMPAAARARAPAEPASAAPTGRRGRSAPAAPVSPRRVPAGSTAAAGCGVSLGASQLMTPQESRKRYTLGAERWERGAQGRRGWAAEPA
jgi:hypothetical protein